MTEETVDLYRKNLYNDTIVLLADYGVVEEVGAIEFEVVAHEDGDYTIEVGELYDTKFEPYCSDESFEHYYVIREEMSDVVFGRLDEILEVHKEDSLFLLELKKGVVKS